MSRPGGGGGAGVRGFTLIGALSCRLISTTIKIFRIYIKLCPSLLLFRIHDDRKSSVLQRYTNLIG